MQKPVLILASLGLILVAWRAGTVGEPRLAVAVVIGALGGVALYHAAFGFTGSWRRLVRERRTAGCRAQLLLLAITCCLSFPLMDYGEAIGITANGWVVPMTLTSAFGAALFGVGMQLGGGCGSGTLFTVGGGSTRMMLTLMAFIAGSVWWTGTGSAFHGSPSLGSVSLLSEFGALGALLLILAVLGVLALLLRKIEQDAHGMLETPRGMGSIVQGPWALWFGALVLAVVIVATFVTLGRPWGITAAFPLWGVKALDAAGVPIGAWNGWSDARIAAPLFAHSTGVMNFGVILGAFVAAAAAGRFAPKLALSSRDIATALVGGLMMGYGARLANGCNIGGFVGGVVSGSLHGWWWLLFGFAGSTLGVWLRGKLGMDPSLSREGKS